MPYNLHVIRQRDFIRLDAQGKVDLKRSREVLVELARSCVERKLDCALLDVRGLEAGMLMHDLYLLARSFPDMGFKPTDKLAILHKYNSGERAELFAMFATDRGWNVRAFEEYEEAMEWFSTVQPVI